MRFIIALACILACTIASTFVIGCNKKETIEDQVLAQFTRAETAAEASDVNEIRNTMTSESWATYEEELRLAREATPEQVRALTPSVLHAVVLLRNRLDTARLKSMTAENYLLWQLQQELKHSYRSSGVVPHTVTIRGDNAEIYMGQEVETEKKSSRIRGRGIVGLIGRAATSSTTTETKIQPIPGLYLCYKNLNGFWYYDRVATTKVIEGLRSQYILNSGMSAIDFEMESERENYGGVKADLLSPPK